MALDRERQIRERAYQRWEQDGCPEGRADDYWHQAERDIGNEEAANSATVEDGAASGESAHAEVKPQRARQRSRSAKKPADQGSLVERR